MKRFSRLTYTLSAAGLLFFFCGCAGVSSKQVSRQSFYVNLNNYPLYAKNGFNPADIAAVPDSAGGSWVVKRPEERKGMTTVESLGLPDMPRRTFLSPFREKDREYTLLIPFALNPERELLVRLLAATGSFNSNETEEVLREPERYRYEKNGDLIIRLREQAENLDYDVMHKELGEFPGMAR